MIRSELGVSLIVDTIGNWNHAHANKKWCFGKGKLDPLKHGNFGYSSWKKPGAGKSFQPTSKYNPSNMCLLLFGGREGREKKTCLKVPQLLGNQQKTLTNQQILLFISFHLKLLFQNYHTLVANHQKISQKNSRGTGVIWAMRKLPTQLDLGVYRRHPQLTYCWMKLDGSKTPTITC